MPRKNKDEHNDRWQMKLIKLNSILSCKSTCQLKKTRVNIKKKINIWQYGK